MNLVLLLIWFLPPVVFFLSALYIKLESISKKHKKSQKHLKDLTSQGLFLLVAGILTFLINKYIFVPREEIFPTLLPFYCYQLILYPIILFALSLVMGPSKEIKITKAPRLSERKQNKYK